MFASKNVMQYYMYPEYSPGAAMEESKDLSNYSFNARTSSLLAHEACLSRSYEKVGEKIFRVKGESSYRGKPENSRGHDKGRDGCRNRDCGGKGRDHFNEHRHYESAIQC